MTTIEWRYKLKPHKGPGSKNRCPQCGGKKTFRRYIRTDIGEEIADHVGRCDRENNCGYHFTPKQYFTENPGIRETNILLPVRHKVGIEIKPIDFLPFDVFEKSVANHESCDLFPFLEGLFGKQRAKRLCEDYFIGSSKYGYTAFWQVDYLGPRGALSPNTGIRQVKIISYLPNGRRDKEKVFKQWINKNGELQQIKGVYQAGKKILRNWEANIQSCFFGEYLLSDPDNNHLPIALVESEKTACIASVFYPGFVWLSTGGIDGCNWTKESVSKVLKGRDIVLFPDVSAFDKWKAKGSLLARIIDSKVVISDYLELTANESERKTGIDVADWIL